MKRPRLAFFFVCAQIEHFFSGNDDEMTKSFGEYIDTKLQNPAKSSVCPVHGSGASITCCCYWLAESKKKEK
jgi:hypothetical protein